MSAENQLYAVLSRSPEIQGFVGDRIYPDIIPEKKPLPAVVFTNPETQRIKGLNGEVHAVRTRFTIASWAATRTAADAIAAAVAVALDAEGQTPEAPFGASDPETGCFAGIVEVDWWDA